MIKNTEDANRYYQLVNQFIDEYVETHKIQPSRLSRYLKNNSKLKRFLERNGLSDVKNIDRVVKDVLDDREYMEKDGVLTFESFNLFESDEFKILNIRECLWKGIEKANITHEKILANHFGVSLSSINISDSNKHLFSVEDINDTLEVFIFTEDEINIICENIKEYSFNQIFNKTLKLEGVGIDLNVNIKDFIDKNKFESHISEKIDNKKVKQIIGWLTSCEEVVAGDFGFIGIEPSNL
jgi:hypothetical protein